MFVAYTGYGRIATLGEEVKRPRTTIPRAIIATLVVTMVLYGAVAAVGIGSVGGGVLSNAAGQNGAPLAVAAQAFGGPGVFRDPVDLGRGAGPYRRGPRVAQRRAPSSIERIRVREGSGHGRLQ